MYEPRGGNPLSNVKSPRIYQVRFEFRTCETNHPLWKQYLAFFGGLHSKKRPRRINDMSGVTLGDFCTFFFFLLHSRHFFFFIVDIIWQCLPGGAGGQRCDRRAILSIVQSSTCLTCLPFEIPFEPRHRLVVEIVCTHVWLVVYHQFDMLITIWRTLM